MVNADFIGFTDPHEIAVWNGYLAILKSSHARLTNEHDALVGNLSKTGRYTPKEGVEAWKFAGDNRKGFSPINVPN